MYKNDKFKFSGAQCFKQMRHTNLCVEREHFSHSINANPRVMRRSFNDVLQGYRLWRRISLETKYFMEYRLICNVAMKTDRK